MVKFTVCYNPTKDKFYLKKVSFIDFNDYVGKTNSFGHVIVAIYVFYEKKAYLCESHSDFLRQIHREEKLKKRRSFKNRVINRLIYFLHKLKD